MYFRFNIIRWPTINFLTRKYLQSNAQNEIFIRQFYCNPVQYESALAKLRKNTGYAFALCRKALEQNDQDIVRAEKWLRAEAAKQGWEKAERVKSRATGQGLIGIYTRPDQKLATMVEVKCETDFVARNEHFIKLVSAISKKLATINLITLNQSENIHKLWIIDESKLTDIAGNMIVESIQKLGENIKFLRGCIITGPLNSDIYLLPYAHAVGGKIDSKDKDILLGKYGTIIAIVKELNSNSISQDVKEEIDATQFSNNIEEIGWRLGQHIIGFSPKTVNRISEKFEENIDNKSTSELVQGDEEPEELMRQKFIFNEDITVEQYLKNSRANVLDFVRIECGENYETV